MSEDLSMATLAKRRRVPDIVRSSVQKHLGRTWSDVFANEPNDPTPLVPESWAPEEHMIHLRREN